MATQAERRIRVLTSKKEALYSIIQTLLDLSKKLSNEKLDKSIKETSISKFKVLYRSLDSTHEKLLQVIDDIVVGSLEVDENYQPDFGAIKTIDEIVCHIHATAEKISRKGNTENDAQVRVSSLPRLPQMELPEFSGEFKEWETFYSVFNGLIHENENLTDSDKVRYLIGRLKGAALSVCSGIPPIGENYLIIWKALIEQYEDKRSLANNYLEQILYFKPLLHESSNDLNNFISKFDSAVRALENLNIDDIGDFILSYHALSKLDVETVKHFELSRRKASIPTYAEVIGFVKEQAKLLSLSKRVVAKSSSTSDSRPRLQKSFMITSNQNTDKNKDKVVTKNNRGNFSKSGNCVFCNQGWNFLSRCVKFQELAAVERYGIVKDHNWCFNCLSPNHGVRFCKSIRSCFRCGKRHHSLLHGGKAESGVSMLPDGTAPNKVEDKGITENLNLAVNHIRNEGSILLSTAVVKVLNGVIENQTARFLLDSGSQANLITLGCCKKLGLLIRKHFSSVEGLGKMAQLVKGVVDLTFSSRHDNRCRYSKEALVVDTITDNLPKFPIDKDAFPHLLDLQLADDTYFKPGQIDGIIGAELFPYILESEHKVDKGTLPIAVKTTLGYTILGKVPSAPTEFAKVFLSRLEEPIENLISKFWEIEEVPKKTAHHPDDVKCELHYVNNFTRDDNGRFMVALPFKSSPLHLGKSQESAKLRFFQLEKRFSRFVNLKQEYARVMEDFIVQGHMRRLVKDADCLPSYYIPHHAVFKQESSTPLRIVLDASASSDNGISLNDLLYTGFNYLPDICTLLLNFRLFEYALTSDVRQMYRQIKLRKDQWRYQRLFWRFDSDDELDIYELTTVAFGVRSSPFLALRTIKQLISEEGHKFPTASKTVLRDLYMDDLVTSVNSLAEAQMIYEEAIDLFQQGGFELTKWSTNSFELLNQIPHEKRLSQTVLFKSDTKILGIRWNPTNDILSFHLDSPNSKCTKRNILSAIAKCYDPIGLMSPFILFLKILMKRLWHLNIDWDEKPPLEIERTWSNILQEWPQLHIFHLPRHIMAREDFPIMLLAFCDASTDGYGCVIYVRTICRSGDIGLRLLCAKSRVSPSKYMTIPRLELCAALLLSNLVRHVIDTYEKRVVISKIWTFSDSKTVLQWLNKPPQKDIFVSHRIDRIREVLPEANWRHIEGIKNHADCVSRGLTPLQLSTNSMWLSGPDWAKADECYWPISLISYEAEPASNNGAVTFFDRINDNHPLYDLIQRCSSWSFILRSTVWVLRFLKILEYKSKVISVADLFKAELILVKIVQNLHFGNDINKLEEGKLCSKRLWKLRPFIKDGLLRVGGRIGYSNLRFEHKHPLLLPSKDAFVERLIDFHHQRNLHTGPHLLEAIIRRRYWILAGRNIIRSRVQACNTCFRSRPSSLAPIMADLPFERVQRAKPFYRTGIDYFGPVQITMAKRKNSVVHKAYVCLFVCLSIKAIHMELVSSLSTAHFLQAFKRFISRRGTCKVIFSDRGTNFIGAKTVLKDVYNLLNSLEFRNKIEIEMPHLGVEWKMNPPSSPHMGGIWESNVKSVKTHIHRVLGNQLLTYEEFSTLLCEIEALLNSRPLCVQSSDVTAPSALTPAHFLNLSTLDHFPSENVSELPLNRLDRFQLIDRMVQDFWKRWHTEYLVTLQRRQKWSEPGVPIKVGMVVVLKQDNVPPLHWPLAVISDVQQGKDGEIRVVTVKTPRGEFVRPAVKVCPLPTQ